MRISHPCAAQAAKGARVGLVDADVHGPSTPVQIGAAEARVQASPAGGGLALPVERRGVRVASMGFVNATATHGGALRGPLAGRGVAKGCFTVTST